jgi:isorenieratene synthase
MVERTDVVVCGGGIAGITAATLLAERGVRVVLLEKETFLGGRAASFPDRLRDGTAFEMERGFHAFFRQYHNLRDLLRRVDPRLAFLAPMHDYPLLGPNGARESFADLPVRTPFNLIELVRRTPTLGLRDLMRVDVARAVEMLSFDPLDTYGRWDGVTAREYLDSLRFPDAARHMLFDVFAHSFFNPEDDYSAAELLAMFHFYFLGNPDGLVFDVMRRPFGPAIFEPLAGHLETRGVSIRRGVSVERIDRSDGRVRIVASDTIDADAVVLALSVPALKDVASRSRGLPDALSTSIDSLDVTAPFAVLRLFFDRPPNRDRAPFAGTTGLGILDNISIFEKLEDESLAWATRTGGSVVELHAYAVDPAASERDLRAQLIEGLYAAYPETRSARVIEDRFLLRRDCPAFRPGSHAARPRPVTEAKEIALAGDFVRLPFATALMERAATSGMFAANALLRERGLHPHPIRVPTMRGMMAR